MEAPLVVLGDHAISLQPSYDPDICCRALACLPLLSQVTYAAVACDLDWSYARTDLQKGHIT